MAGCRASQSKATADNPFLRKPTDAWADPYFDPRNIKLAERTLFA